MALSSSEACHGRWISAQELNLQVQRQLSPGSGKLGRPATSPAAASAATSGQPSRHPLAKKVPHASPAPADPLMPHPGLDDFGQRAHCVLQRLNLQHIGSQHEGAQCP